MINRSKLNKYSPSSKVDNVLFDMSYFEINDRVEEHTHSCIEFVFVTDGTAEHISGKEQQPLCHGSVCLILPGGSHGMEHCCHLKHYNISCSNDLLHSIGFKLEFLRGVWALFGEKRKTILLQLPPNEFSDVLRIIKKMWSIYKRMNNPTNHNDLRFQFALLLCLLGQTYERYGLLGDSVDTRLVAIANYMSEHLDEKITVALLAKKICLSASQFNRVFLKKYGMTPIAYLLDIRIKEAERLLHFSSFSIKNIAIKCGFSSLSYFSNAFMAHKQMRPGTFRAHI